MVFSSVDGSLQTGFTNDLRQEAPSKFKVQDSNGYDVLQPTEPFTGGRNDDLVAYYREKVSQGNAYIIPDDYASSHVSIGIKNDDLARIDNVGGDDVDDILDVNNVDIN
ncbi:unnamed protein product [Rotaria sordida]|uniref:Uncharacterized protein n=1 Tax=Rotaria sordida TaxID=392033 RepID=A0A819U9G3_9BILA|nr:unnamed protein product [Rotaria sordida]